MWLQNGTFFNRGFFYGPWLPVYGLGSIILYKILSPLKDKRLRVFFLSGILGALTELVIGLTLKTYWHLKYWDYDGQLLALDGYVCLYSFLGFCLAGLLWVCFLSGLLQKWFFRIKKPVRLSIVCVLMLLFLTDLCYCLLSPNQGRGITFSSFFLVSYILGL